ncbi:MAG: hypothetical protein J7507_04380 [Pseudoxanthomonas sp.]|nr:hypothetical protein [Pseudoxanthomonas sp.]
MADPQQDREPQRSYFIRNPWRPWVSGAFAGASVMLTVTTLFYALGRLPIDLVGISVVLAGAVFAFGFYARRRADRFDAEAIRSGRPRS